VDGFEVALALAREDHPPAVVLTSSRDPADFDGGMLLRSGVRGFVPKSELSGAAFAALLP
jgi:DNA-binding NarL/FixJ family response regulator